MINFLAATCCVQNLERLHDKRNDTIFKSKVLIVVVVLMIPLLSFIDNLYVTAISGWMLTNMTLSLIKDIRFVNKSLKEDFTQCYEIIEGLVINDLNKQVLKSRTKKLSVSPITLKDILIGS